jgi:hypothetical protein
MSRFFPLPIVAALASVACSAPTDDGATTSQNATAEQVRQLLDVNDLSILFPLDEAAKTVFPRIRVTDNNLWKASHFGQVVAAAQAVGVAGNDGEPNSSPLGASDRASWFVFGVRFDPCAPGLSAVERDAALPAERQRFGGRCLVQLRLVAQPLVEGRQFVQPDDYTAHLIFTLAEAPRATLHENPVVRAMTERLVAIKQIGGGVTAGKPLDVHPTLRARGAAGDQAAAAVRKLIRDAVGGRITGMTGAPQRDVAFMGLRPGRGEWTFLAGRVDPATDRWVQTPRLPGHLTSHQELNQIGQEDINNQFEVVPEPAGAVASTFALFADEDTLTFPAEQIDGAFAVENPRQIDFFMTDCVSCHSSSQRIDHVKVAPEGRPIGAGPESASRMKVPAFVTGYAGQFARQGDVWSTRNFGYFAGPNVSGRTVNETTEIAQWLNEEVLQAGLPPEQRLAGPGLSCPDDGAVERCLLDASGDEAACFAGCQLPPTE